MSNLKLDASPLKTMQLQGEKMEEEEHQQEERRRENSAVVASSNEKVKEENVDGCVNDDDEGYHTPTSPSHRIVTALECPPAPRKPRLQRRYKKRKVCCCSIEIKDVELIFRGETENEVKRRKVREEIET